VSEEATPETRPPAICDDFLKFVVSFVRLLWIHHKAIFSAHRVGRLWNHSFKLQTKTVASAFIITDFLFIFIVVIGETLLFVLGFDYGEGAAASDIF
jgi:hypothetical protein